MVDLTLAAEKYHYSDMWDNAPIPWDCRIYEKIWETPAGFGIVLLYESSTLSLARVL